jgi:multiple sugar transport system permease protein
MSQTLNLSRKSPRQDSRFFSRLFPSRFLKYQSRIYLILVLYLTGVGLLVFLPAVMAFVMAFFHYDAISTPLWNGLTNFIIAYSDELFQLSVQNALALIILPVPLRVFGALLVARLMQRRGRLTNWFRAAVLLPNTIPLAAFAVAGLWIFNPLYGPVNHLISSLGVVPPSWFVDPLWAKPALILLSFWSIGEGFLICLAVLQDIPVEIEEAAKVEGAGRLASFSFITLPIAAPTLALLALRDMVLTFQNSFIYVTLTTAGGPYYATYTLSHFIYEQGFDMLSFGVASAALWVLYALTGLLVASLFYIVKTWNIGITDEAFIL